MSNLHTKTANQVAQIHYNFLKELAAYGEAVLYSELKSTGGTWDPISETMKGGVTTEIPTVFDKAALIAPIKFNEDSSTGRGGAYTFGHNLGDFIVGSTLVARVKTTVPLTVSGIYTIQGSSWKLSKILETFTLGKLKVWNLVKFVKA